MSELAKDMTQLWKCLLHKQKGLSFYPQHP